MKYTELAGNKPIWFTTVTDSTVTQPLTANIPLQNEHCRQQHTQFTTQNLLAFCTTTFSPLRHYGRELVVRDPQAAHCVLTLLPAHAACRMCAVKQILFTSVK